MRMRLVHHTRPPSPSSASKTRQLVWGSLYALVLIFLWTTQRRLGRKVYDVDDVIRYMNEKNLNHLDKDQGRNSDSARGRHLPESIGRQEAIPYDARYYEYEEDSHSSSYDYIDDDHDDDADYDAEDGLEYFEEFEDSEDGNTADGYLDDGEDGADNYDYEEEDGGNDGGEAQNETEAPVARPMQNVLNYRNQTRLEKHNVQREFGFDGFQLNTSDDDNVDEVPPSVSHLLSKDLQWPFNNPKDVKIYLVHIGKAGGKSLYRRLFVHQSRNRLDCRMLNFRKNDDHCLNPKHSRNIGYGNTVTFDSIISQRLYAHFHMVSPRYTRKQKMWLRNATNLLLVTLRDPVDRIVSAFNYHHFEVFKGEEPLPRDQYGKRDMGPKIYLDCFKTVEDLAKSLVANTDADRECQKIGRALVQGNFQPTPCAHFHWNYQYYAETLWPGKSKTVAVLRTESLWEDVARVESLLDGDPTPFLKPEAQVKFTHGSESYRLTSSLSDEGTMAVCCALRKEIQVYHDFVLHAVNLKADEKIGTILKIMNHCGIHDELSSDEVAAWRWSNWYRERCTGVLWWT